MDLVATTPRWKAGRCRPGVSPAVVGCRCLGDSKRVAALPERGDAVEHGDEVPEHGADVHLGAWCWCGELVGPDASDDGAARGGRTVENGP